MLICPAMITDRFSSLSIDRTAVLDYAHAQTMSCAMNVLRNTRLFYAERNHELVRDYSWVNRMTQEKYETTLELYQQLSSEMRKKMKTKRGFNTDNISDDTAIARRLFALKYYRRNSPVFDGNPFV